MSSAPTAPGNPGPYKPSPLAAFLSYLIPGLGQIYQGRYGKGVLFMVSLLGMFMLGQAMGQWQNVYLPREREQRAEVRGEPRPRGISGLYLGLFTRWHYGGQIWIGVAAWPALYHYYQAPPPPDARPRDEDDAQPFWLKYQTEPDEAEVNKFLIKSDKAPDLGWVYTIVAGMLNILVIYDAYAGPMFIPLVRPTSKDALAPKTETKKEGVA